MRSNNGGKILHNKKIMKFKFIIILNKYKFLKNY